MNKFKILAQSILLVLFAITMSGCSSSSSSTSGGPSLQLTPESAFDFGTVTVGNSAAPLEITITNSGSETLNIDSIALSDPNNFSIDINGGTAACTNPKPVLAPGGKCSITVSFTSNIPGIFPATLDITSNVPSQKLTLTAIGEAVAPKLNVTINQVDIDLTNCSTSSDVVAYVSVTDQADFPVKDLTTGVSATGELIVEEGGVDVGAPTGDFVGDIPAPISIALVMDNSSSMSDNDILEMNDAANKIVDDLNADDMVRIIKFDKIVYKENSFTKDEGTLRAAIAVDNNGTGTALYDALQEAVASTIGQTMSVRKAVIVITDGNESGDSIIGLQAMIDNASAEGIPVFVIGLGESVDDVDLEKIATDTSGEYYAADVAANLRTIVQQQLTEVLFTDQYILSYTSTTNSATPVTLKVTANKTSASLTGFDEREITLCP